MPDEQAVTTASIAGGAPSASGVLAVGGLREVAQSATHVGLAVADRRERYSIVQVRADPASAPNGTLVP